MTVIKMFEKPVGMRDTLPTTYEKLEFIRHTGRQFLYARGYDFIKTPSVEYYDTVGKASAIDDASLFKLVDHKGNMLVLRPDVTTPIARIATAKLLKEKIPQRLAYFASVFRAQQTEGGRPAEFEQMGIELIGDNSVFADAEVILTAIELLQQLKIDQFTITIGHAALLQNILQNNTVNIDQQQILREQLVERNYVGYTEAVKSFYLDEEKETILLQFIDDLIFANNFQIISKYTNDENIVHYMDALKELLSEAGVIQYVTFDFTITSHISYYTGMLFEVFAAGSGFALGNGGRYDGLLRNFGTAVGATGFGLRVDRLLEITAQQLVPTKHTLLLFERAYYAAALKTAAKLRATGSRVTLQEAATAEHVVTYKEHFDEVVTLRNGQVGRI